MDLLKFDALNAAAQSRAGGNCRFSEEQFAYGAHLLGSTGEV
jgi:hypothetical protein